MPNEVDTQEPLVELETEEAVEVALPAEGEDAVSVQETEPVEDVTEDISEEPSEEELASYSAGVKKRIDKLTAKYREAERREQAALDYAKSVKAQNENLQQSANQINEKYSQEYAGRVDTDLRTRRAR